MQGEGESCWARPIRERRGGLVWLRPKREGEICKGVLLGSGSKERERKLGLGRRNAGGACLWGLRARPSGRGRAAGGRTGGAARRKDNGQSPTGPPRPSAGGPGAKEKISPRKGEARSFSRNFPKAQKEKKQASSKQFKQLPSKCKCS